MSSDYQVWKDIEERFKFFLLLTALCGCGFLAWHQLIYVCFMLLFFGMAGATASLYDTSEENVRKLSSLDESDLREAIAKFREAENQINQYLQQNPKVFNSLPQLLEVESSINAGKQISQERFSRKKRQREIAEEQVQQRRQHRENWVNEKRKEKNLRYGEPPDPNTNICSSRCPIRATDNIKKIKGEKSRGIYYEPDHADYKSRAIWCFESVEHAIADNFRASEKGKRR